MANYTLGILAPMLSRSSGGLSSSVPNLANNLSSYSDVDVHVFGVTDKNFPEDAPMWGPKVHSRRATPPRNFNFSMSILNDLMNVSPDIIDVQGLWNGQSLTNFIYQKRKPRPYIVTPRGMLDPWSLKRSSRKKGLVSALYERKHLQNATILRATAKMEADHFVACGLRNEMAIVPNGIKIPTKAPDGADKPSRRQLLFLSRVHPKKGIDYLLRAWAKLSSHFPSWDLLIVGPDEVGHTQEMKNYALKLGLSNVFWRGPADDEEKSKLYTSSDLFVLPSHAENFGLVVGEALSYGLPVIVSRNCPWEGVVENSCGWWINLEDSELQNALFEAMSKDRGQLDEMGLRGSRWISNTFSVESVAEQMAGLYEWLLFGGTTPKYVERS